MYFVGLILAAMFGACIGVLVTALCVVSKREDERGAECRLKNMRP